MDALSSQANLAGYVMAIKGADALNRILPMMMTPAGTVKPAKVFIIGAGVAGIQAALELADGGHQVYLVEKEPSIGGIMAAIDKTFPTMDCSI